MASGCRVAVYDLYPNRELSPDAEINRAAYKRLGGEVITKREDVAKIKAQFVVDAIYGTGLTSSVRSPIQQKKLFRSSCR